MSRALGAGIALLAAAAVVWAVLAGPGGQDDTVADLEAVADVAGRFGEALFTYDADSLATSRATLAELGTERFTELYDDTLEDGLAGTIGETGGSAVGEVREVFVGPVVLDEASAVVVIDADITGTGGTRTLEGLYLRVDLLRGDDGLWRVDLLTVLTAEATDLT